MKLLRNAVLSLQAGVEDLLEQTPARTLSAVRNLHSGVLLLLKSKLQEMCPPESDDVLLKAVIEPKRSADGEVVFVGKGRKTVDVEELLRRLRSLGVEVDEVAIKKLTEQRNAIEHFYADVPDETMRALAVEVLVVAREFARQLDREPRELFGADTWSSLLDFEQIRSAERAAAVAALGTVEWPSPTLEQAAAAATCDGCGADLWGVTGAHEDVEDAVFACRACGREHSFEEFAVAALRKRFAGEAYDSAKDGEPSPLTFCHGCFAETWVRADDACARCDYEPAYERCSRCDERLDIDDQDLEGLCSWCHHMASKDD